MKGVRAGKAPKHRSIDKQASMKEPDQQNPYHALAKDAGNRLRSYILSVSSGASGVFFLALTRGDVNELSPTEKWAMLAALISFVATVAISLRELRIDAKRFYYVAKQKELPEEEQDWGPYNVLKSRRLRLLYTTYVTFAFGLLATVVSMATRLWPSL